MTYDRGWKYIKKLNAYRRNNIALDADQDVWLIESIGGYDAREMILLRNTEQNFYSDGLSGGRHSSWIINVITRSARNV